MDAAEAELFERSLRQATERHSGADLDEALDELGWSEALETDPRPSVSLLFELQGAANVASSALERVLLGSLGIESGLSVPHIVLPAIGDWSPPGKLADDRLTVTGIGTSALATGESTVVVAKVNGEDAAVEVPVADLTVRLVDGLDPWLGLVEVRGDAIPIATAPRFIDGWTSSVALAQRALGHELVGAARAMLELARTHALERMQFGKPISQFQAIRHRLADALVAIETADAALDAGWRDPSPQMAAMAKAVAGHCARTASRHCQQVLAGVGFTTEHALHRYVRRVLVLDELFGSARALTKQLGDDLLTTRQLPPLLPL